MCTVGHGSSVRVKYALCRLFPPGQKMRILNGGPPSNNTEFPNRIYENDFSKSDNPFTETFIIAPVPSIALSKCNIV